MRSLNLFKNVVQVKCWEDSPFQNEIAFLVFRDLKIMILEWGLEEGR